MKRTLLIIITAAALILAACQNTIRYEYDINDGKITLLGQLSSVDSVHSVFLSMSYPDRIDSLADATVSCYVNGERHLASKVHPGYQEQYDIITQEITMVPRKNRYTEYRFQAGFKPGDDVRIEASKGDMKAWVELEVPQPGKIVSVDTVTVVKKWSYQDIDGTDTYEQEYVEFTIRLKDAEGTDSYFTLDAVMAEVTKLFSGELITETLQSAGRLDYETFHDLVLEDAFRSLEIVLYLWVAAFCLGLHSVESLPNQRVFFGREESFVARGLTFQGETNRGEFRFAGFFAELHKLLNLVVQAGEIVVMVAHVVHCPQDIPMILRADCPLAVNISRVDFLLRIVLHRFAHLYGRADAVHRDAVFFHCERYEFGISANEPTQGSILSPVGQVIPRKEESVVVAVFVLEGEYIHILMMA